MPRLATGLSAIRVKTASPGRYMDGNGLRLLVRDTGARFWIFRYTLAKKTREMGLGRAGADPGSVSLSEARRRAGDLHRAVRDGRDPLAERDAAQAAELARKQAERVCGITFRSVAEGYIKAHAPSWRNAKHAAQWDSTLATYAYPVLGDLPVRDVGTEHVVAALEPIWIDKPETASRLRGRIESVLDYARVREWRAGENPARWRGHLDQTLPRRAKVRAIAHHAALPWREVGAFMASLGSQKGVGALALRFAVLTGARTGEVLGATWSEINLVAKVWTVPAVRMKGGREHRVPLSVGALALLGELPQPIDVTALLFPGAAVTRPLSNMAMAMVLRRMKRPDLTVHGFRSCFRDWVSESTGYPRELAEAALAHAVGDKVEAAYQRGDLLEKRRAMMAAWGDFCAIAHVESAGHVVALRQGRLEPCSAVPGVQGGSDGAANTRTDLARTPERPMRRLPR